MPGTPLAMDFSMIDAHFPGYPHYDYLLDNLHIHTSASFWSYEYCKRLVASEDGDARHTALKVLLCGGIAGVATWASVFPLDVVKTRLQAQPMAARSPEDQRLLGSQSRHTLSTFQVAKEAYRAEGLKVFYRGLGVCSVRAFVVNAVQVCLFPSYLKVNRLL